ncbi:MAG: sulfatase-like hydrolase/transferase [Phycisphaeraceae bacterium]|nr:sulfatase-like hydrolase/transferase [Phycisphaeraceae bacterium]
MPVKPNILLIMSDEHDPAVAGCYGDKLIRTPHLDELSAGGITFDAAYCNSPLCVPSRLSFTAGQYVSRCAAWNNECRLPRPDYPSLPRLLTSAGYDSLLCGKQHYHFAHRYGFTELFPSAGNFCHMNGRGTRRAPDDFTADFDNWRERSRQFHVGNQSPVLNHDQQVTEEACRFLLHRRQHDKPFFLFAGYVAPHFPLIAPQPYAQRYLGRTPPPNIPAGFLDTLPTNYKHLRAGFGLAEAQGDIVQTGRDLYWALTDWLDNQIGILLSVLRRSAVADNTIVIYTSDHGENKGDHGLWWKNCMYEHAARVPLIVHDPRRWATSQRRPGVCSLLDLTQTIADLAGAPTPQNWNGHSLVPCLDDANAPWKNLAVSEYYGHNIASGYSMIRHGPWKYVYHNRMDDHHPPERELYFLPTDPGEFHNLTPATGSAPGGSPSFSGRSQIAASSTSADESSPAQAIASLHALLINELGADPDENEQRCRSDLSRGYAD